MPLYYFHGDGPVLGIDGDQSRRDVSCSSSVKLLVHTFSGPEHGKGGAVQNHSEHRDCVRADGTIPGLRRDDLLQK